MAMAYLLLGGNEGDRAAWLRRGLELISDRCGRIWKLSSVYETAAWGLEDQPAFLNMVVMTETPLLPESLLDTILGIEQALGRQRTVKWGQRRLDIDILFYGSDIISLPGLHIPHPHIAERRFTLAPLAELSPDLVHPVHHKTIKQLLEECRDPLPVSKTGLLPGTSGDLPAI